ncbi:MAG TPA: SdpI family protein [Terriglobales bacterium]
MKNPPELAAFMTILLPIVNILISIPLVMRIVPQNRLYGFRTRRTLSDERVWYEANYMGGKNLIIASVLALVARAVIFEVLDTAVAPFVSMGVLLVLITLALILSMAQLRNV